MNKKESLVFMRQLADGLNEEEINDCKNQSQQTNILLRFSIYRASIFSYLNYYSSSLLSLSRQASLLINYLQSHKNYSLLQRRSTQLKISRVYLNLLDNLFVRSSTVMNFLSYFSQHVAKQGPAVTVTPVFTPIKPRLLSSLFVFYQSNYLFMPSLLIHVRYTFVLTILQNNGIFRHQPMSNAMSQAFDELLKFGRPWGLAKIDCRSPIFLASLFMTEMNAQQGIIYSFAPLTIAPAHLASANAASLPLGSISPYNRSSIVMVSPRISQAVVPDISDVSSSILTSYSKLWA